MAVVFTVDSHWDGHLNRNSPEALVGVIGLESSYIVYSYSAVHINFVIILEKHGGYTPLIRVNMVKASIQVTQSPSVKEYLINSMSDKIVAYLLSLVMAKLVPSS